MEAVQRESGESRAVERVWRVAHTNVARGRAATGAFGYDVFFRSEYHDVLLLTRSMVGSLAVAEDLTQEAFFRALSRWSEVSTHANPEAWVRRVAINLASSRWRRLRSEAKALMNLGAGRDVVGNPDHDELWAAVRSLPPRERQITVLFYVGDMKISTIADMLELSEGTVKATLHHARKKLAAELGAQP